MSGCRALTTERFVTGIRHAKAGIAGIEGHKAQGLQIEGRREADDWLCFCKHGFACVFTYLPELPF